LLPDSKVFRLGGGQLVPFSLSLPIIHPACLVVGFRGVGYVKGANIAGFVKVADAMLAYGIMQ